MKKSILFLFSVVGFFQPALAQSENENLLIQKLEKVQIGLSPHDPSKVAVTLRLADLYAERARQVSLKESNDGCTDCQGGKTDRQKAISFYQEAMPLTTNDNRKKVMLQVGHLQQLNGEHDKALAIYKQLLNDNSSAAVSAESEFAMGEIYFQLRDYKTAFGYYEKLINNQASVSRGLAAYRRAWCLFNTGQQAAAVEAMKTILATPQLMVRNGVKDGEVDPQFNQEVSRDYVNFLTHVPFQSSVIESIYNLSPSPIKLQNSQVFATELERLGKKDEALTVWNFVYGKQEQPEDRRRMLVAMTAMNYELGRKAESLQKMEQAMTAFGRLGPAEKCTDENCLQDKKRMQQLLVVWNKTEKKDPSAELLTAYKQYLSYFNQDIEVMTLAAQVAKERKDFAEAWVLLSQAQIQSEIQKMDGAPKEVILTSLVDIAESLKNEEKINSAYETYLKYSVTKTKYFEVSYQQARQQYEISNYLEASEKLRALAQNKSGNMDLRKKAADLSLDSLVLMKNQDAKLAQWATEYAVLFPQGAKEFNVIGQKSVLTQSAQMSDADAEKAYQVLAQFNAGLAEPADQVKYYKNKIVLGEKLKKYNDVNQAIDQLLHFKPLSEEDLQFAWTKKADMAELQLDFTAAFDATKMLTKLPPESRTLKLAVFAELSGKPSAPYYLEYMKVAKNEEQKRLVATEMIMKSSQSLKDLVIYAPLFQKNTEDLARLYLRLYARTHQAALLTDFKQRKSLHETPAGQILMRQDFLVQLETMRKKITQHQLNTKSDQQLGRSIQQRAALLKQLEDLANQAIRSKDWTSQLLAIHLFSEESGRFYNDILSAPLPQGMSEADQQAYMTVLSTQATPFQTKATESKKKVDEFWQDQNWEQALKKNLEQADLRQMMLAEVSLLKGIAPEAQKQILGALTTAPQNEMEKPSLQALQEVKQKVIADPLNKNNLQDLLSLEQKSNNTAMVGYLQSRMNSLEQKETK